MDIGTSVRRTGDATADGITDAVDEGPMLLSQLHGSQRVGCLTALRDGNHHIALAHDGIPVSELRCVLYFHRYATEGLYQLLTDESCMPGGSAGHDDNTLGFQHLPTIVN